MAWPSWMPVAARPTGWTDWSAIFRAVTPREWPKRLFVQGSQAYSDLMAFGETLALARDMLSFLQIAIWPAQDTDNIFLDRWESVFGIQADGSTAERQSRLIATMRQRGTMTRALVKAIMCRAWDSDDPSTVGIVHPAAADVATAAPDTQTGWTRNQTQMHIYHTAETAEPDRSMALDMIAKIKPAWETWSVGRWARLEWEGPPGGPGGGEGFWNRATWS